MKSAYPCRHGFRHLTNKKNPSVADLRQGWRKHVQSLEQVSGKWHRPILFTEIGYPSIEGAGTHPWGLDRKKKVDLEGQKNLYKAFFEEVYPKQWLHGVYWWVWFWNLDLPDLDRNFPPYGKPAGEILKQWYKAQNHLSTEPVSKPG